MYEYKPSDSIVVLAPRNTDLDGYACAVGYAEYLQKKGFNALPWFEGEIDAETNYVLSKISSINTKESIDDLDLFVYVDGSNLELFPNKASNNNVVEVIDHHFPHDVDNDFPNAISDIQKIGAAATLIVERFKKYNIYPSNSIAILLFCAIHSNTQGLRGSVTKQRDIDACDWLESFSEIPSNIVKSQFEARKKDIINDLPTAIKRESKKYYDTLSKEYTVSQLELPDASKILQEKKVEILNSINLLSERSILNMVDVSINESTIVIPNIEFRTEIQDIISKKFDGNFLVLSPIMLRKQIVAAIAGKKW